ncbi:MAG: type II toxin-antitoxin system prevent-host-death family antitoxin [Planctomycetes bacterium]|nr:type II toxin-antitoxin system prevent-host-death family antitoxin [Planctomycetota bacterium]
MVATRISSTQLARTLGDILARVRYKGESFVVEKNGKPIAVLAPCGSSARTWDDFARAWSESGGLDADWADLLETIGREDRPSEDPWASH